MNRRWLPLSIVIPCADDTRIKDCLDSIDESVEVIVVLNGASQEVVDLVAKHRVRTVELTERNLSHALNAGIEAATQPNVILMDSDCRFQPGAIRTLLAGLERHDVAKGLVVFQRDSVMSGIIARAREYAYYDTPKPYNPFLALKKGIKDRIGGYYFDETIHWTEDADLNTRLKRAGIEVNYVFSAKVLHPPLTLPHDLKSSFRYGLGKRIRVEKGTASGAGTHFGKTVDVMQKKGFTVGLYYIVWNCFYLLGYVYQRINDPYQTRSRKVVS